MTPAETAKWDKLSDAMADYASQNGDGFGGYDYRGATDCQTEGYMIAAEAISFPDDERADYIDTEAQRYPESAQYLIAVSADYRLAELVKADDAYPFKAEMAA